MNKTNVTTIKLMLESGEFKALQALMLKNNFSRNAFFNYEINSPNFKGDSWKAFYFFDIERELNTVKKK